MITASFDATTLIAKLQQAPKLRKEIEKTIEQNAQAVAERAREKVSGEVLHERSGRLRAGIAVAVSGLSARVTSDALYARIQEYGGRNEMPDIVANAAKALAFAYQGRLVFAKSAVAHPVNIPQRSYLRSSLAEQSQLFLDDLRRNVIDSLT
jgi:phage gpG-like protein